MTQQEPIKAEIEQIKFQLKEYKNFVSGADYNDGYTPSALKLRLDELYRQLENPN